ncbi:hypothetical protein AK88_04943 [Plasmodium fragile]|uniref:Tryptophan/threonine-rich plasmodium antigen C-terminal domain-containing protein n=1 Tax=Plasmodium fragile TaxID=5857 RepID=A0A0D9QEI4_PLAFR|nr:uncharacterized protein AK88_04943 [Plasmodium fragile]KJP85404.1 hypothetical protein AK88_04943 [Plasmodium fragile]
MEETAPQNSKFTPLNIAAPIINEGINVGKRLIGKLNIPAVADIVLVFTFLTLYKLCNDIEKIQILKPRENHETIYNPLKIVHGELSIEEKIQKHLREVENHNRKVQQLQNWFKDVEKRVKAERRKIYLATGRAKSDVWIQRAKETSQHVIKPEQEIELKDNEDREIVENGVRNMQKGLSIIEDLMQKLVDVAGKIPKDNLGSYRQEIEIPEDKMSEFNKALELFEEGLKIIQARVENTAGENEIEEIKIELEEYNDEEEYGDYSSPYLYSQDSVEQKRRLASKRELYKGKMEQVQQWISEVDGTIKDETKKIKEGVEAEVKPPESYAQDAEKTNGPDQENTVTKDTHDNEYEQGQSLEEEPDGELTKEWKDEAWKKWMNNTEKEWENFTQSFEHHKQQWIQKKESEWEEWLANIHYNWVGFINKLEGDYINDKQNAWTKWDEKEWSRIIEMEWTGPMKVKWTNLVEKNEQSWGDYLFHFWNNWKDKKWNEWNNKNWKKKEEEKWNNLEKREHLNKGENMNEWEKRVLREKQEWENWVNEKEHVLIDAEEAHWKKWKEYKWNYLNEWMKQVKVDWLKAKPWEVWKQTRSDFYESNAKVEDDVQHSEEKHSLSS